MGIGDNGIQHHRCTTPLRVFRLAPKPQSRTYMLPRCIPHCWENKAKRGQKDSQSQQIARRHQRIFRTSRGYHWGGGKRCEYTFCDPSGHGEERNPPNCPQSGQGRVLKVVGAPPTPVQKFRKSVSHRCKPCLRRCKPLSHQCKRLFPLLHQSYKKHSPLTSFGAGNLGDLAPLCARRGRNTRFK